MQMPGDNGPDGLTRGFKDLLRILPFNSAGRGAYTVRVGDAEIAAAPFYRGARTTKLWSRRWPPCPALIKLATTWRRYHQRSASNIRARFRSRISPGTPGEIHFWVDAKIWTKVPAEVADKNDNPGEMVNFLLIGRKTPCKKASPPRDGSRSTPTCAGRASRDHREHFKRVVITMR